MLIYPLPAAAYSLPRKHEPHPASVRFSPKQMVQSSVFIIYYVSMAN